jgi:hypothetical protein
MEVNTIQWIRPFGGILSGFLTAKLGKLNVVIIDLL